MLWSYPLLNSSNSSIMEKMLLKLAIWATTHTGQCRISDPLCVVLCLHQSMDVVEGNQLIPQGVRLLPFAVSRPPDLAVSLEHAQLYATPSSSPELWIFGTFFGFRPLKARRILFKDWLGLFSDKSSLQLLRTFLAQNLV